jgi:hypothetical protein
MSVKYQIEVPAMSVAKGVNNKTHDLSIEPKYNRKVILTLQNAVTGDKKKPYLHFSVGIAPATSNYTPAYPEGDSINVTPGIGEYKLKHMWIFNGLYNDYLNYTTINNDDYKEVLLVHEKIMGADTHYLYVFFLMSTKSVGGDENENTFFDVWKNSNLEIKGPPQYDESKKTPYTTTGILDIIPRTKKVHIWKDLTRQLNTNLIAPTEIKGAQPYSNVVTIIVNPEIYTSKKIPSSAQYVGKLFGDADKYNVNFDCNSSAAATEEKVCAMKTIKTIANKSTKRSGNNHEKNISLFWNEFSIAGTNVAEGEDSKKGKSDVYFSSGLQDYWFSSNTFMKAFAGGGSGTVLTTCVEVEQKVGEGDKKDKSISSYEEKHMLPEGKTWYGWDRRPGAKGEDAGAARLAFEKSFYPGPIDQFDKHYMFWILFFLGIFILVFVCWSLIKHYKDKVLPQAMKAKGMKVS